MKSLKAFVIFVIVVVFAISIVNAVTRPTTKELTDKKLDEWMHDYDPEKLNQIGSNYKRSEAAQKGDTYCSNCDKFIEGKVRICTFCGEYID